MSRLLKTKNNHFYQTVYLFTIYDVSMFRANLTKQWLNINTIDGTQPQCEVAYVSFFRSHIESYLFAKTNLIILQSSPLSYMIERFFFWSALAVFRLHVKLTWLHRRHSRPTFFKSHTDLLSPGFVLSSCHGRAKKTPLAHAQRRRSGRQDEVSNYSTYSFNKVDPVEVMPCVGQTLIG